MDQQEIDLALVVAGQIIGLLWRTSPEALAAAAKHADLLPFYQQQVLQVAAFARQFRSQNKSEG